MLWRKASGFWFLLLGVLSVVCAPARAETVKVVTEEFPPYNYTDKGAISGFSTAVVRAVLKEANLQGEFQSLPWARAYETAQINDGVLIYSIGRTPQREHLFKWVGVIAPTQYYLFSLPQRKLQFDRLEQAKPYQIGTVNEDVGEQFLASRGFAKGKNLQSSVKYELNYEKLKRGRVDLWIMPELVASYIAKQAGDVPDQMLARSYAITELGGDGYYMAFGAGTSDALVERLANALVTIKRNGTYDALKKKWL